MGSLKPNDFGLFDVQGNVFNWCQERRKSNHRSRPPMTRKSPYIVLLPGWCGRLLLRPAPPPSLPYIHSWGPHRNLRSHPPLCLPHPPPLDNSHCPTPRGEVPTTSPPNPSLPPIFPFPSAKPHKKERTENPPPRFSKATPAGRDAAPRPPPPPTRHLLRYQQPDHDDHLHSSFNHLLPPTFPTERPLPRPPILCSTAGRGRTYHTF